MLGFLGYLAVGVGVTYLLLRWFPEWFRNRDRFEFAPPPLAVMVAVVVFWWLALFLGGLEALRRKALNKPA